MKIKPVSLSYPPSRLREIDRSSFRFSLPKIIQFSRTSDSKEFPESEESEDWDSDSDSDSELLESTITGTLKFLSCFWPLWLVKQKPH